MLILTLLVLTKKSQKFVLHHHWYSLLLGQDISDDIYIEF